MRPPDSFRKATEEERRVTFKRSTRLNGILSFTKGNRIGKWNVRGMAQEKMEIVKREMIRTKVEVLGVSELHWTGMGRFQSGNHTAFYSGHEKTRRHGVAII